MGRGDVGGWGLKDGGCGWVGGWGVNEVSATT